MRTVKTNNTKSVKEHYTVLFYTNIPRLFRATLIGHLFEVANVHPTIVLSETLDQETTKLINNKKLFPHIIEVVSVDSPFHGNIVKKNRHVKNVVKSTMLRYTPDIVISLNDMNPVELYLMRYAKKIGATTITIQAAMRAKKLKDLVLFSNLHRAYLHMPGYLPLGVKLFLIKLKKAMGHYLYYWLLPLTAGEKPFFGPSSFVQLKGTPGMRDGDYYVVFSKREYDISINEGIPAEKLYILSHPLARDIMSKFLPMNIKKTQESQGNKKILTLMYSTEELGFKKGNYQAISKEVLLESRIKMVTLMVQILKDWKIFIKPHPSMAELPELLQETRNTFESISTHIKVVNPRDSADTYIAMSDVIVGIPPASNTLFTASLQCPEKVILSVDLSGQFLGDVYKDFPGIEYIDTKEALQEILQKVAHNTYHKKHTINQEKKVKEFSNTIEMLDNFFQKNHAKQY